MSQISSEHILENNMNITGNHTDDELGLSISSGRKGIQAATYEPICSFKTLKKAQENLKDGLFGAEISQMP